MSLKRLAIKPSELKALDRSGLLLFCARCVMRVEPWFPRTAQRIAKAELARVAADAFAQPALDAKRRARELNDLSARTQNALDDTDAPRGQSEGYALHVLAAAVEATALFERADVMKQAIDCAKYAGSIAAIRAHAGLVTDAPRGKDPVDYACAVTWAQMRVDLKAVAFICSALAPMSARKRVATLREHTPLWSGRAPSWAAPG